MFDVHRVAAEVLGVPWEKCDVTCGNTSKNVPNTCGQGGSQTTHAMTRAAHAAATDAKKKLQEIAARTLGGNAEFDGHELPADINTYTKKSAAALAGQGLMGVARDTYGRDGTSKSYVAGFAEVEVDVETGSYRVLAFDHTASQLSFPRSERPSRRLCRWCLLLA